MVKNGLPAIHPGEYLAEILDELGMSQAEFARRIGVSAMRISHVVRGSRPVTAELALLFGRALGQSPQYWMNLQTTFDLKVAETLVGKQLPSVVATGTRRTSTKPDKDLPELTEEMLARAVLKRGGKPLGRPPLENTKVAISLRLPPDVVARWRASGAGWQTRMAKVLEKRAP